MEWIKVSDPDREKDILRLCVSVLNTYPDVYYNPNGADESTCPFCYKKVYNDNGDMSEIKHDNNCAYLIAKDLSTGLLPEPPNQ